MAKSEGGMFGAGPAHRSVEIGVALATAIFALIIIVGSYNVGMDWAFDGPKAGFFPFYIGLIILIASIVNLAQIWTVNDKTKLYAQWGQLRQVSFVVIPTAVYVTLIPWIGIYAASVLLIGLFMKWLGRYGWPLVAAVAIGVPIATFVIFEKWFLVPLPKGPIEAALGF